ncbi:hypothetical protein BCT86_16335 [Vibrio breoganii]|uniref:hypothetical protein n=1 Tax=Vibrio breoganii TaxID=553239 RepID=UPI000C8397EF|nr:hypothetical protein [Vibrio breoganii]PML03812.1 hypothetical protein BCT86_16335 [Vibrio breoganii]PMO55339.1 hypothetical protein BCT07_15395 [Vibrio breoganii]
MSFKCEMDMFSLELMFGKELAPTALAKCQQDAWFYANCLMYMIDWIRESEEFHYGVCDECR